MKNNEIRAVFDADTITVYQAYRKEIALPAVENQKFVFPFKMDRMTWIKPSFLWMMYRSGWAKKEGQEHVLAIKIKREGFDWAINNGCLSHFDPSIYNIYEEWKNKLEISPVRIQWDPEKNIHLNSLNYRSIQIGLKGIAIEEYVNDWIINIEDISNYCYQICQLIIEDRINEAEKLLPIEMVYNCRSLN